MMIKELTPLKALKEIGVWGYFDNQGKRVSCEKHNKEEFAIVKAALKRIPKLEKEIEDTHEAYTMAIEKHIEDKNEYIKWAQEGGYNQKELKAFKIIKEKMIDVAMLCCSDVLSEYNEWARKYLTLLPPEKRELTQAEYELLKEVL